MMGIALILFGREEQADGMIEQLLRDKVGVCFLSLNLPFSPRYFSVWFQDALLRYGGIYTIALAYAGTGNNGAIRRLLHVAVSDVSDDVRRAAVTALGFVMCNVPKQVPRVVSLLAESFNPHVRYGAAFAVGIACAGTALPVSFACLFVMFYLEHTPSSLCSLL